jgi:hypothetical protein
MSCHVICHMACQSLNLHSKILNWVNWFVQAQFLTNNSQELLSSSLVECLLLTPKVPGSNPETGGMWEGERSFRVFVL